MDKVANAYRGMVALQKARELHRLVHNPPLDMSLDELSSRIESLQYETGLIRLTHGECIPWNGRTGPI